MRRIAAFPCLLALCTTASLLAPGAAQAGQPETKAAPTSGTVEYSSGVSEVDSCSQANAACQPMQPLRPCGYQLPSKVNTPPSPAG